MNVSRTPAKPSRTTLHAKKDAAMASSTTLDETAVITNSSFSVKQHSSDERQQMIAALAYQIAERRGFMPGSELSDWLAAEAEVDVRLMGEGRAY
jgi:hypothetical protein